MSVSHQKYVETEEYESCVRDSYLAFIDNR